MRGASDHHVDGSVGGKLPAKVVFIVVVPSFVY